MIFENSIRIVTMVDLEKFADQSNSQFQLPEIVRRLIYTSIEIDSLRMPSGESVTQGGWDGEVIYTGSYKHQFIPKGTSFWELTTTKSRNTKGKANADFKKRTENTSELEQKNCTYVFVTLRNWSKKNEWILEKKSDSSWKDIKVIDGNDLELWLENTPAVGYWLANELDLLPEGVRTLSSLWEDWRSKTDPPLTEQLVLSLGSEGDNDLEKFLNTSSPIYHLLPTVDRDIALAYLYSKISAISDLDTKNALFSKALVVENPDRFRMLSLKGSELLLIPVFEDPPYTKALENGHKVFLPVRRGKINGKDISLWRLTTDETIRFLKDEASKSEHEARRIAERTQLSITSLRYHLKLKGTLQLPKWKNKDVTKELLEVLLLGSWDVRFNEDKKLLHEFSNLNYADIEKLVHKLMEEDDSIFLNIGSIYTLTSHEYVYSHLKEYVTPTLFRQFLRICNKVFSEIQSLRSPGEEHKHSPSIRKSIAKSLVLLATNPPFRLNKVEDNINVFIGNLLTENASIEFFNSISDAISMIAQASPKAFLSNIYNLLQEEGLKLHENQQIIWALEKCGWSTEYLNIVTEILLILSEYYEDKKTYTSNPMKSIYNLYNLWFPGSSAPIEKRLGILETFKDKYTRHIVDVLIAIMPWNQRVAIQPSKPTYHQWADGFESSSLNTDVYYGITEASEILLNILEKRSDFWPKILDDVFDFPIEISKKFIDKLNMHQTNGFEESLQYSIWCKIEEILYFQIKLLKNDDSIVDELLSLHKKLVPADPYLKFKRLFEKPPKVFDLNLIATYDRRIEDKIINSLREKAIQEIYIKSKSEGIKMFLHEVESPDVLGFYVGQDDSIVADDYKFIKEFSIKAEKTKSFLQGLIQGRYKKHGIEWLRKIAEEVKNDNKDYLLFIFSSLPFEDEIFSLIGENEELNSRYWRSISLPWYISKEIDLNFLLVNLISAQRAFEAMEVVSNSIEEQRNTINPKLIDELIDELLQIDSSDIYKKMDSSGFINVLELFLNFGFTKCDINLSKLADLEFHFYPTMSPRFSPTFLVKDIIKNPVRLNKYISIRYNDDQLDSRLAFKLHCIFKSLNIFQYVKPYQEEDDSKLIVWVNKLREKAKSDGLLKQTDNIIGQILAYSPEDPTDKIWPIVLIRDLLDGLDSTEIANSMAIHKFNLRGVVQKTYLEGGKQERELAKKHQEYITKCEGKWRIIIEVYNHLISIYESLAEGNDIEAERERHLGL